MLTNIKGNKFFWTVIKVKEVNPIRDLPIGWEYWSGVEIQGNTIIKVFSYGIQTNLNEMSGIIRKYWPGSEEISINQIKPSKNIKEERILCSAIYIDDGIVYSDSRVMPGNKKSGMVVCGQRHHNCYGILHQFLRDKVDIIKSDEGFLTSKGNFLTRDEAKELAFRIGQITETISTTLTSEDLW